MISYRTIKEYNTSKEGVKCMVCNYYYFKGKFDWFVIIIISKVNLIINHMFVMIFMTFL